MADIFDSSFEKVTFVESEADSIFEKNFTDAFKINEDYVKVTTEEKNVINGGAAAGHKLVFIEVIFLYQLLRLRFCQGYQYSAAPD